MRANITATRLDEAMEDIMGLPQLRIELERGFFSMSMSTMSLLSMEHNALQIELLD